MFPGEPRQAPGATYGGRLGTSLPLAMCFLPCRLPTGGPAGQQLVGPSYGGQPPHAFNQQQQQQQQPPYQQQYPQQQQQQQQQRPPSGGGGDGGGQQQQSGGGGGGGSRLEALMQPIPTPFVRFETAVFRWADYWPWTCAVEWKDFRAWDVGC